MVRWNLRRVPLRPEYGILAFVRVRIFNPEIIRVYGEIRVVYRNYLLGQQVFVDLSGTVEARRVWLPRVLAAQILSPLVACLAAVSQRWQLFSRDSLKQMH